jgi:GT2 family glycosyltransferase
VPHPPPRTPARERQTRAQAGVEWPAPASVGNHRRVPDQSPPSATVVVPTRDRPRELERCLAALGRQTLGALEVVVVDDGSSDPSAVEAVVERSERARLIRLGGLGPAAARNAGAREAGKEVVCFLDDDCEPEPGWAERLASVVVESGKPVAGRTRNGLPDSRLAEASQAIVELLQLSSLTPEGRLVFAPSCNLAAPAELARELPFDETYPLAAGEDRDWSARAVARGMSPVFAPDATVIHRHRLSVTGFVRQQFAYGRGAARLARAGGPGALLGPRARLGLVRAAFGRGAAVGALVCVAQLATAAGLAFELFSAPAAARRRARSGRRR